MRTSQLCQAAAITLALSASARGAALDLNTHGNWIGKYGSDGYILNQYAGNTYYPTASTAQDVASLPSYVSGYAYSANTQGYVWATGQSDARDLQNPASPTGSTRTAATAFNGGDYSVTITLSQAKHFQLAVYGLDWDNYNGRDTTVSVGSDSAEFTNAAPTTDAYHQGEWALFDVNAPAGPLTLNLHQNAPSNSNAVISGIMFDPAAVPEPASLGLVSLGVVALLARRRK